MAGEHAHKGHRHGHGEQRSGVAVGVLTCSDRGARGERADVGGPTVHNLVLDRIPGAKVTQYKVVPRRPGADFVHLDRLGRRRASRSDPHHRQGTGLAPSDITPEATHAVIDRAVPAFPMAMLFESLRVTPYAMLTRAAAGIRGKTLIINLPGNPKAIQENLDAIIEVLPHAVQIARGEDTHAEGGGGHKDHAGHAGHGEKHGRATASTTPSTTTMPQRSTVTSSMLAAGIASTNRQRRRPSAAASPATSAARRASRR